MVRRPHHVIRSHLVDRFETLHHEHESYKWWVLGSVMIGTFMAVLDATIVNVALSKIMASFGVSVDKVEWVLTAYLLVFGVMLPTSAWIADHFGYKRTYFFSLIPPNNASGNFTKITQRVPVKISIDRSGDSAERAPLLPGMSVEVKVKVE